MLILKNLKAMIGMSPILYDINLTIHPGEIVTILGRNGAGKSTLLRSIAGLQSATGNLSFDNNDIISWQPFERARLGIAYVPQGRGIFPQLTVEENLTLGLSALVNRKKQAKPIVPKYLYELFPILTQLRSRKGGLLSGGEQQQLAIARALVMQPQLLMLDEPTEGIQPSIVQDIGNALIQIQKEFNLAILLVEQYLDFAWKIAKSYYVMQRGEIICEGNTSTVSPELIAELLSV